MASLTWTASSRVGTTTSAWGTAGEFGDRLDDGEGERRRLAGAGGGLAEQVDAGQQLGDRFGLDGRGLFVAEFDESGEELLSETERGEAALLGLDGGGVGIAHCATSKREQPSLGLIRVRPRLHDVTRVAA